MQQDTTSFAPGGSVDAGEILSGIWRRKLMILILSLLALGLAVLFVKNATPKYSATSKVLVENLETPYTKAQNLDRQTDRIDERDVLSQVEVASSPDIALKVLLGLDKEMQQEFTRLQKPGLLSRLSMMMGFSENPSRLKPEQRAMAKFEDNSTVYNIPRSSVIVMNFTSSKPEIAAVVANRLAETYVKETRTAQSTTTDRAGDWLGAQVDVLRQKVVESEVAVEKFRAEAGLVRGSTNTLGTQELSELNSQLILAGASKAEALARAESIRDLLEKTGSVDAASEVVNSTLIQRLREQQVRVRGTLAELSTTYLDNHPRIKAVKKELVGLDRQVKTEALKIVDSLEQQASIAATREASLRVNLDKLKKKASAAGVDEVKLRALEREAFANRQLLESFLSRYSDAASRVKPESQPGLARIIETAMVPSVPSFPKKGPIVVLAGVGGLVLGLGLAFLLEVTAAAGRLQQSQARPVLVQSPLVQSQPMVSFPDDTPSTVTAAPLPRTQVITPVADSNVADILPRSPNASAAMSNAQSVIYGSSPAYAAPIRKLATTLLEAHRSAGTKRIAVASLPGAELDGAALSIATARCLSGHDLRVVVVEADGIEGRFELVAGLQRSMGLAELLMGKATFADVIVPDQISPVHFVRNGLEPVSNASQDITMVLEALDHAYDLVLLYNGVTKFPADKDQTGITACQTAIVIAGDDQDGEAVALSDALVRAGLQSAQVVHLNDRESADHDRSAANLVASA